MDHRARLLSKAADLANQEIAAQQERWSAELASKMTNAIIHGPLFSRDIDNVMPSEEEANMWDEYEFGGADGSNSAERCGYGVLQDLEGSVFGSGPRIFQGQADEGRQSEVDIMEDDEVMLAELMQNAGAFIFSSSPLFFFLSKRLLILIRTISAFP